MSMAKCVGGPRDGQTFYLSTDASIYWSDPSEENVIGNTDATREHTIRASITTGGFYRRVQTHQRGKAPALFLQWAEVTP